MCGGASCCGCGCCGDDRSGVGQCCAVTCLGGGLVCHCVCLVLVTSSHSQLWPLSWRRGGGGKDSRHSQGRHQAVSPPRLPPALRLRGIDRPTLLTLHAIPPRRGFGLAAVWGPAAPWPGPRAAPLPTPSRQLIPCRGRWVIKGLGNHSSSHQRGFQAPKGQSNVR